MTSNNGDIFVRNLLLRFWKSYHASSGDKLYLIPIHQEEEAVYFMIITADFYAQGCFRKINDLGIKNAAQTDQFSPIFTSDTNTHENQFTINALIVTVINNLDYINELLKLFNDLIEYVFFFADDDSHTREVGVVTRGNVQCMNVIAPATEQSRDAG